MAGRLARARSSSRSRSASPTPSSPSTSPPSSNIDQVGGAIGFVLVALVWFYLVSLGLMAGAVINALRYELHDTGALDTAGWTAERDALELEPRK